MTFPGYSYDVWKTTPDQESAEEASAQCAPVEACEHGASIETACAECRAAYHFTDY